MSASTADPRLEGRTLRRIVFDPSSIARRVKELDCIFHKVPGMRLATRDCELGQIGADRQALGGQLGDTQERRLGAEDQLRGLQEFARFTRQAAQAVAADADDVDFRFGIVHS